MFICSLRWCLNVNPKYVDIFYRHAGYCMYPKVWGIFAGSEFWRQYWKKRIWISKSKAGSDIRGVHGRGNSAPPRLLPEGLFQIWDLLVQNISGNKTKYMTIWWSIPFFTLPGPNRIVVQPHGLPPPRGISNPGLAQARSKGSESRRQNPVKPEPGPHCRQNKLT